ncbi:MAG: hypothetical protein ACE5EH_03005 [Gammaproteobacteria bacterium]
MNTRWFQQTEQNLSIFSFAVVMGIGCLWGGFKVLQILAHRITPMNNQSSLIANVGTSLLVLAATPLGAPGPRGYDSCRQRSPVKDKLD